MAMRKPVIATDCGGNRELVSSPDVGWLIAPRDVAALTQAIAEVIDEPERAAVVGSHAREHVIAGFSKELRIARLESLYEEVLRERR
jgi:glycosyltransferase involved in cell wall biosynthesis